MAISGYLIWYYARKNCEWYVKGSVFIAWFFGFSIIVLLPYDVYISYVMEGEDGQEKSIAMMEYIWRINYWTAFLLCNFIFPMLGEYVIAGDFTVRAKLWTAFIQNLIFYIVMGVVGGVALIYLWYRGQFNGENSSFSGFLIFCINAYGLVLIILFLGYGIIAVPKKYFGMKSFAFRRNFVYFKVFNKEETYHDRKFKLEELTATAIAMGKKVKDPNLKKY
jgi:hypothetical protein